MLPWVVLQPAKIALAYVYPAYQSYKALKADDVDALRRLERYWVCLAAVVGAETVTDIFFSWVPFYEELKLVLVLALQRNNFEGARSVYQLVLQPRLDEHEPHIDAVLDQAHTNAQQASMRTGQVLLQMARDVIIQLITSLREGHLPALPPAAALAPAPVTAELPPPAPLAPTANTPASASVAALASRSHTPAPETHSQQQQQQQLVAPPPYTLAAAPYESVLLTSITTTAATTTTQPVIGGAARPTSAMLASVVMDTPLVAQPQPQAAVAGPSATDMAMNVATNAASTLASFITVAASSLLAPSPAPSSSNTATTQAPPPRLNIPATATGAVTGNSNTPTSSTSIDSSFVEVAWPEQDLRRQRAVTATATTTTTNAPATTTGAAAHIGETIYLSQSQVDASVAASGLRHRAPVTLDVSAAGRSVSLPPTAQRPSTLPAMSSSVAPPSTPTTTGAKPPVPPKPVSSSSSSSQQQQQQQQQAQSPPRTSYWPFK